MIKLSNINKSFAQHQVLDELELELKIGDRIALIGQNGAGKTTLIRTLLGQYTAEGQLSMFGLNPRQQRIEVLQKIGFVPQHSPPIQMSVGELVDFSAALSLTPMKDEVYALAGKLEFDIEEQAGKPFFKLSGGMKQKLLIALALSKRPEFLIMDEPAANLDPAGRKAFFDELSLLPQNTTMLLSSHRVDELLPFINRIIEMDCGRIVHDQQLADEIKAGKSLDCKIQITGESEAIRKTLDSWKFSNGSNPGLYSGKLAEADRTKFFIEIAQFSKQIKELKMEAE
jgi:ABC-2 type transport system ATP-binding protein